MADAMGIYLYATGMKYTGAFDKGNEEQGNKYG
jgi:hypothetical protein